MLTGGTGEPDLSGQTTAATSEADPQSTTTQTQTTTTETRPELGWRAALTADLQNNDVLTQFKEVKDLGKAHVDLHGRLANAIFKPGAEAKPEEVAEYRKALGVPETAEGYEFDPEVAKQYPEGVYSKEVDTWAKDLFHRLGIPKDAAAELYKEYTAKEIAGIKLTAENRAKQVAAAEQALKTEWGAEYDGNLKVMRRAVEKFGPPEFKAFLDSTGAGNNPLFIKTFYAIGKAMLDDSLEKGGQDGVPMNKTEYGMPILDYPSMRDK